MKLFLQITYLLRSSTRAFSTNGQTLNRVATVMAEQVIDNNIFKAVRLPNTFRPIHYDLLLKPDLKNFTFDGEVTIKYENGNPKDDIVLHASELEILSGCSCDSSSCDVSRTKHLLQKVTYSPDTETATLSFKDGPLASGVLNLKFKGVLNDKMKGFYKTTFKVGDKTVHAATSKFEPTFARRALPCWDEPAVKATFTVTLVYDDLVEAGDEKIKNVALSNMPIESTKVNEQNSNEITVTFQKSPKMSTYLLAFIVGPFSYIEGTDGKRPVRVYTTPDKIEQGRYALDVAIKSLTFYEKYFDVDYPLPKMDLIAIPDFVSGAMENWGLVTYRETALLVDPINTSTSQKQYVALVVAHELSHMWFGNLVTMEWWTHLWLNEGFATFMEFLCIDHIFPEYEVWPQFVTDYYGRAMELDSLHNSHPIEVSVEKTSEISNIFDAISYSKGSSVIRMLYNYIGDEAFRKGMESYLKKFAYQNTVTADLWDALEASSKKPVRQLMSGWTLQTGYPWISVSSKTDGNGTQLSLTQSKFASDGKLLPDEVNISWMIPVSATTKNGTNELCVMNKKTCDIAVPNLGDSYIKLNSGTIGLYRCAYSDDLTNKLLPSIIDKSLPPMDRLGLVSDFFYLCQAGKKTTVDLLKFMNALKGETNYNVWSTIDLTIGRLNLLLSNTDFQDKFHTYGRNLYQEIFASLGWTPKSGESGTASMNRAQIVNRLVVMGEPSVVEEARRKFKAHLEKTDSIPADLRSAVYKAISIYGDDVEFDNLFKLHKQTDLAQEKDRIARSLGFAKDLARTQRVIDFALSDEIRLQDKIFVIVPIGMTHPRVAFKLLQDNKEYFKKKYESGNLMSLLIKHSTSYFANEEMAQEVAKFFQENQFPGSERIVQQSLETIRLNANWLNRDSSELKKFLS